MCVCVCVVYVYTQITFAHLYVCIHIVPVLAKHCVQGIYMADDFKSDFLEGEEFHTVFRWLVEHRSTWTLVHNIFLESAPLVAVLVPPSSSMAAVLKALTPLPRKSDQIDTEVDDRCQSHTLRFGKCL